MSELTRQISLTTQEGVTRNASLLDDSYSWGHLVFLVPAAKAGAGGGPDSNSARATLHEIVESRVRLTCWIQDRLRKQPKTSVAACTLLQDTRGSHASASQGQTETNVSWCVPAPRQIRSNVADLATKCSTSSARGACGCTTSSLKWAAEQLSRQYAVKEMHQDGEALAGKLEETPEGREMLSGSDKGDVGDASVGQRRVEDRRSRRLGLSERPGGTVVTHWSRNEASRALSVADTEYDLPKGQLTCEGCMSSVTAKPTESLRCEV